MLFNSFTFIIFLPIVFAIYWLVCCPRQGQGCKAMRLWLQNIVVVIASYVFYGWWDWRFLILILFTSVWAWASGLAIERFAVKGGQSATVDRRKEKWVVAGALIVNLSILGVFKYYNFFVESFIAAFNFFSPDSISTSTSSLHLILPVGISFYTFQALSYVIDVYRKDIRPTRDLVAFLAFVSFFPQLVAGPIERATNLLPQFLAPRYFDRALAIEGCRQMLWGLFKKVLVADSCAYAANNILACSQASSLSLWVGMLCFTFQIYGDFSGYSDIAIGCSKLFGVKLMRNFNMPYFSRDIAEFWRRWHISLTTWFRDYLYIPLGGSRCGTSKKVRNTFIVFLVSGFWHGANWTFVVWGAFHAFCFLPLLLCGRNRKYVSDTVASGRMFPSVREFFQMTVTFVIAVIGWTFFRAPNITTANAWLYKMLSFSDLVIKDRAIGAVHDALLPVMALILIEWFNRGRAIPLLPRYGLVRWFIYMVLTALILFWRVEPQTFIYFQF